MVSIRTDLAGIAARRTLGQATRGIEDKFAKLSSGYRITRAQDDAAGMGISRALRAQLDSYHQAVRNTRDAMSLLQTMEGGLSETTSLLVRIRELAVQFVSGTANTTTRLQIKDEVDGLLAEINRVAKNTAYNHTHLLDGSSGDLQFQIGIQGNDSNVIVVPQKKADTEALDLDGLMDLLFLATDNEGNSVERAAHTLVYANTLLGSEMNQPNAGLRNGYGPQNLIFNRINGTQSSVQIDENDTALEIAAIIGSQTGFSAVGENGMTIDATGFTAFDAPAALKFSDGTNTFAVNIAGLTLDGIRSAINNNTTLQNAGIYAETGATGGLSVLAGRGHDISVDAGGATLGSMDIRALFSGAAQSVGAGDVATVGGTVRIAVEPGYSLDKNNPVTQLLDANMNRFVSGTNNGYPSQTFVREDQTNGTATVVTTANDTAFQISQALNQAHSVQTVASNSVTLRANGYIPMNGGAGQAQVRFFDGTNTFASGDISGMSLIEIRDLINNDATLATNGISAQLTAGDLRIDSAVGHDIQFDTSTSVSGSIELFGNHSGETATLSFGETITVGGKVEYTPILNQAQFSDYGAWNKTFGKSDAKMNDATFGSNEVGAQTITINGALGPASVSVADGESAHSIAQKMNTSTDVTGVRARALTTITLDNLSHDGTIAFNLATDDGTEVPITATVSRANLRGLVDAINSVSTSTQIFARFGDNNAEIILSQPEGRDIRISDFEHTSAEYSVDPATAVTVSFRAYGNKEANGPNTPFVNLLDGGNGLTDQMNGTVVGGEITLSSFRNFTVASDIDGGVPRNFLAEQPGSLFNAAANQENQPVTDFDVPLLERIDKAIELVSDMRTEAGAYFNRIMAANESNSSAALSASQSHSRLVDVDIAEETARLSSDQVLRDAGTAVLAQINQSSQAILKLLE